MMGFRRDESPAICTPETAHQSQLLRFRRRSYWTLQASNKGAGGELSFSYFSACRSRCICLCLGKTDSLGCGGSPEVSLAALEMHRQSAGLATLPLIIKH